MGRKTRRDGQAAGGLRGGAVKNGVDGELAMNLRSGGSLQATASSKSPPLPMRWSLTQTLWLKTHFPAEFMAAVMTADMDSTDKIVTLVDECQRMGLTRDPAGRQHRSLPLQRQRGQPHRLRHRRAVKGRGRGPSRRSWRAQGSGRSRSAICSISATGSTSRSSTNG